MNKTFWEFYGKHRLMEWCIMMMGATFSENYDDDGGNAVAANLFLWQEESDYRTCSQTNGEDKCKS